MELRRDVLKLDAVTDAYRVVFSEADGLSGLVVDRFADTVVIEFFSAGMFKQRDVIRANALGNFRTMLEAVAQSASMMYYLDNASNTRSGPNENFARELLELHTLGVDGGYTQQDVQELARVLTGHGVRLDGARRQRPGRRGSFHGRFCAKSERRGWQRALKAGQTLKKTLAMVAEFRGAGHDTPIVLMGYYNPIYIYGVDRFLDDAVEAGIDGLIIVDLPVGEALPAAQAAVVAEGETG